MKEIFLGYVLFAVGLLLLFKAIFYPRTDTDTGAQNFAAWVGGLLGIVLGILVIYKGWD